MVGMARPRWTRLPRPLTPPELATLLRPFGIKPRTVWPARRQSGDKSSRGYLRADFEGSWAAYCDRRHASTGKRNHLLRANLIHGTAHHKEAKMANVALPSKEPRTPAVSTRTEIDAFLKRGRGLDRSRPSGARGRLIFALDAIGSRATDLGLACQLQADMFAEAAKVGGLDIQLVYYRGSNECCASRFTSSPRELAGMMQRIRMPYGRDPDQQGARACAPRD